MTKSKNQEKAPEIQQPEKQREVEPPVYPGNPDVIPNEDPGYVPFENPYEVPPFEVPSPGEGF